MTRFELCITGVYLNMTVFAQNTTVIFLKYKGLVLNTSGFVLNKPKYVLDMTSFILDMTRLVRNLPIFVLIMNGLDENIPTKIADIFLPIGLVTFAHFQKRGQKIRRKRRTTNCDSRTLLQGGWGHMSLTDTAKTVIRPSHLILHFTLQPFPAIPAILSNIQPYPSIYYHFQPFQPFSAMSSLIQPF